MVILYQPFSFFNLLPGNRVHRHFTLVKLQTLVKRREILLNKFALKTYKNPKTAHMIKTTKPNRLLRNQEKFKIEKARTERFAKSTLNAIAHILNKS